MRRLVFPIIVVVGFAGVSFAPAQVDSSPVPSAGFVNTLMPQPSHLSMQDCRLAVTLPFTAVADGFRDPRLDAAIARCLDRIKAQVAISIPAPLQPTLRPQHWSSPLTAPARPYSRPMKTSPTPWK